MEPELPIRITVVQPPHGVTFRIQRGRADLVPPALDAGEQISFDLTLRVADNRPDGLPNFLGPFAQGPPAGRFIYVNSGTLAGQAESCWTRRAKVHLAGITWELIDQTLSAPGALLEAHIAGTGRDGGPACATVPLLEDGWRVSTKK
jgi:hypothetical protein